MTMTISDIIKIICFVFLVLGLVLAFFPGRSDKQKKILDTLSTVYLLSALSFGLIVLILDLIFKF